ncbi:hypothetical protein CBR_g56899 [Chara braunii]|uniref:Uncharacterized protein n=1 Tax=Chara braunii TaxID=69332 RepID=A0A388MDV3_CHABU|nr:hypothetical protein CBR_g56899 [Chara braunii]|eukprot:GBG92737.1 hypothetical protein CBR_g56899 [Chara braunii]
MSARGGARGKKREKIPEDTQGRERGRRHVPKAKRLRSEEASASLPLQRGRSWAATNEEEDDDVFTTEEEAAKDNVLAPRGSSLQRSSDQSGARRLLTPPPEAQQVRADNTPKAKEVVVDVGGEDDEPLESRRQRTVTQGSTTTTVRICAATEERPPQGGLPLTLSQPRPRNAVAEGGSMEHEGGEGAQQEARVASGGAIAGATAGSSGNVAAVARAREEVPVVEREATHGDNKGEKEDEDPLLSRVRKGGMARDLADRARLWVDDKAFWTTGEGRRLREHRGQAGGGRHGGAPGADRYMHRACISRRVVDAGFISHDRLSRIADCFRLLLAACMWLMRMAGDDPRSHYEAFYFAKLVAKPTLVSSMHRAFDHRRSVIRATNTVTERLGKANATFGDYPKYIPDWASCDIVFGHDATITGPEDAKRRDWLGSGPLEDDDDDDKEDT